MNINRTIIDKLVQSNKNVASLMSSLGKLKEEELSLILDEISKLKLQEPVKKKVEKKNDVDKKITHSFALLSEMVTKKPKVQKLKPINLIKNIVSPVIQSKKESQSNKNYTRENSGLDVQEEKLIVLKSIRDHLNTQKIMPDVPKENKSGGILSSMSSSILGAGVGGILSKGTKALKTVGKFAGKVLPIAFALKSGYDLITGIKDGYSEYKRLKAAGDNTGANNVLFKTFISSSGNLMGIAAGFIPGPIGWMLTGGSLLLDGIAGEFDSVIADKSNTLIQDQQNLSRLKEKIDAGAENNILLLRPNIKNMSWEYKDYNTDSWETIKDNLGNAISISSSRIQANEKSDNGIQTYKLKTEGRMLDLVLDGGVPKIKDENGLREVTPRKNGGKVSKGNDYLVGEKGPELYQTNTENGLSEVFSGINKSFKKMINGFNVDSLVDFFTPQVTIYKMIPGAGVASSAKQILDFSKISTDKQIRFDSFVEQIFAFEGGYSDRKEDLGGKTKFGVTEDTWKAFGGKVSPSIKEVKDISREDAKRVYWEQYYKNTIAEKVDDPAMAYVLFDSNIIMGPGITKMLYKKSGGDPKKFLQLRDEYHIKKTLEVPDQIKNKAGWLNRDEDIRSMIDRGVKQARVDSVKNITKPTQVSSKNSVDKEFLLNNIANALASIVSRHYNGI